MLKSFGMARSRWSITGNVIQWRMWMLRQTTSSTVNFLVLRLILLSRSRLLSVRRKRFQVNLPPRLLSLRSLPLRSLLNPRPRWKKSAAKLRRPPSVRSRSRPRSPSRPVPKFPNNKFVSSSNYWKFHSKSAKSSQRGLELHSKRFFWNLIKWNMTHFGA